MIVVKRSQIIHNHVDMLLYQSYLFDFFFFFWVINSCIFLISITFFVRAFLSVTLYQAGLSDEMVFEMVEFVGTFLLRGKNSGRNSKDFAVG